MIHSKAIKEDWLNDKEECPWCPTGIKKIWWTLQDIWWKLAGKHLYFLKKLYSYARILRTDFDFDGHYIYPLLELKLKRMHNVMLNGHVHQEPEAMHALELAIKLTKRLQEKDEAFDYYWRPHTRHDRKWGEMETWFEPTEKGDGSSYWRSKRPNADTPEKKEQERQEFLKSCEAEEFLKQRDRNILFGIMAKYMPYWWE